MRYTPFLLLIITAFTSHTFTKKEPDFDEAAFSWSRSLAEVVQMCGERHYQLPEKLEDCWIEAINAFLSCIDPHSSFLPPKAYKEIERSTAGTFGGIGVHIDNRRQTKDKYLTVIDVVPGGPADKQDLRPQDKIVEIDATILEGMTTEEATAKLRGKVGTTVEVKILRDNHPDLITATITRDIIKEQNSVCFYLPNEEIYYLSLNMFTQNAIKQIEELIKKSENQPYKGLILDLRYNTGGLLNAAIDIAGLFLPNNSLVVQTKGRNNSNVKEYRTQRNPIVKNSLPIFILINNYTASAAEILAGCLQQHSMQLAKAHSKEQLMVFLVGTSTFGKGSVQEIVPISNNSAIKITTALYFLPGDLSIQGVGIEPEFVIQRMLPETEQMKWFAKSHGYEKSLPNTIKTDQSKKHLDELKERDEKHTNDDKQKKWTQRVQDGLNQDNQFKAAITLVNLYDLIRMCHPSEIFNRSEMLKKMKSVFVTDESLSLQEVTTDPS